ncbi:MAG: response regulator [Lachnospiraceae bacterium]|nr:response regulator [Lachnospiraceae bacterium]
MDMRILMISERKSMLVNALVEGLQKEGFKIVVSPMDLKKLPTVKEPPATLLFYLQNGYQDAPMEVRMKLIQDYMDERKLGNEQISLFLLGEADELARAKSAIPQGYISGMFIRPFRADDVARAIREKDTENEETYKTLKNVLIVDDDPVMLRTMQETLAGHYRVFTAGSGMNAIQLLTTTAMDLILLDYEMPVVKGPQVLEMLRQEPKTKDIPVMFLTAKSDRHSISQILKLKPEGYLLKSQPQSAIEQAIANFFAEK